MDIKLVHITKVFADKDQAEVRAVDDLNIVVPSGKLIGLLGPSGCGKSTTLYMIANNINYYFFSTAFNIFLENKNSRNRLLFYFFLFNDYFLIFLFDSIIQRSFNS